MNWMWLKFAIANTLRNRRRSLVTVTIAALGTAALLLAGGFALFTYESLAEAQARESGHLVIGKPEQFVKDEETPLQYGLDDVAKLRAQLLADSQVRAVLPRVDFSGLVSNGDKSVVMIGLGVEPDAEFSVKGPFLTITGGEVLGNGAKGPEIMLGDALARNLKAKPGSSLTLLASTTEGSLNAMDVTVKAVFSTGVPEVDKRLIYTDIATSQKLLNTQKVSSLGIFLSRMEHTDGAQARIAAAAPQLKVLTWQDRAVFYRAVKDLYNRIFGALGLIIGVIVVFVVTNAMSMAIIERTREIGTLRAMGTLPRQLLRTLSLEGMVLGGGGAIVGILVALAVSIFLYTANIQMPPPPGRSVGYPLYVNIDAALYIGTALMMVSLTMLASAFVARKTVHMPVVDALAHT
ncbi:MAG: FtsX-like permease family protein [Casimicrobium sp.]